MGALTPLSIGPLNVPKAADVLADRIRENILDGTLPEGQLLPEGAIGRESGLSRGSVREAIRILETEGLLTTKLGRNGGAVVRRPEEQSISKLLQVYIRGRGISISSLFEARGLIEPFAASLAATRRTSADLEEIDDIMRRHEESLDDIRRMVQINVEWHLAIVRASGNQMFSAFTAAVASSIEAIALQGEIERKYPPETMQAVLKAHRSVFDAVHRGDAEAASRRMARHLDAYGQVHSRGG